MFKIGDKVRVSEGSGYSDPDLAGQVGTVVGVYPLAAFPYRVKLDDLYAFLGNGFPDYNTHLFLEEELKPFVVDEFFVGDRVRVVNYREGPTPFVNGAVVVVTETATTTGYYDVRIDNVPLGVVEDWLFFPRELQRA